MDKFYVYILYREDGRPFYVGKGCGYRWRAHEWGSAKGDTHKDRIIERMKTLGIEVQKKKVETGLTEGQAMELEIKLIAQLGREPHGPLVNLTDGGEGLSNPSISTKEKRSALGKAQFSKQEAREQVSIRMKKFWSSDAGKRLAKKMASPEIRAKVSAGVLRYLENRSGSA